MTADPTTGRGPALADLVGSVCDGLAVPQAWDLLEIGPAARVVVLVIDGLGDEQLQQHADLAPTIAGLRRSALLTVTPSTTPVALTSLGTGLAPGSHGLVGASFRLESGDLLWPLGWRDSPNPQVVQPEATWWQRAAAAGVATTIVSPRPYATGGLTGAALRGGRYVGADGPGERIAELVAASRPSRSLVYGYWEHLDRAAHVHGVDSDQYRQELRSVDRWVADLLAALPTGVRLILTADHGVVDCPRAVPVDTEFLRSDVSAVAGEPRFRHVYVTAGRAAAVAGRWQDELGDDAQVQLGAEAISAGWFGAVSPQFRDRIGDVVVTAGPGVRLTSAVDSVVSSLIGQHGARSAAELLVPLCVADR